MSRPVVLLVDDEPWFTEALNAALEADGINCVAVTDMTSALRYTQANDVMMFRLW